MSSSSGHADDSHPLRGEIYWIDWSPGRGSEQIGHRPGLIISPDLRNRLMRTCVIAALTTSVRPEVKQGRSPISLFLPAGQPMQREGAVLAFQILTVSKNRLEDFAGKLTADQMKSVDAMIKVAFGLTDDPPLVAKPKTFPR